MKDDDGNLFGWKPDDGHEGAKRRDEGIERAADHADRVIEEWREKAYGIFVDYLSLVVGDYFGTEDARKYAHDVCGLAEPPDGRAWGAVAVRARKAGLIVHDHFEASNNPKKHRCPLRIWRIRRR